MNNLNNPTDPNSPNQGTSQPTQQYEPIVPTAIKKNMIGYFENRANTIIAIWLAVFIGIMFSFLIVEYRFRLNMFIFYTLLLAVTGYIMYRDNNLAIKPFIFLSIAFLSIASVFMRYSFQGYIVFASLLLPIIYVLITVYASKQKYLSDIKILLLRAVCSIGFVHEIIVAIASLKKKENEKKKQAVHILIGIGITAALLIIIVPIMLSADEMFRIKLNDIFGEIDISTFVLKSILAAFIAMVFFGFVYLITVHRLKETSSVKKTELPSVTTIILTIAITLAALFTFFAVVQFNYLFVGVTKDLPSNFSYAQYARNGYFQLVALSIISFTIILICTHFSKKGTKTAKKAIKIILTYFNALNIYLLISAAYKMQLYQNEFGLTSSRLLVYILLVFEAILILGLTIKIFKENLKFIKLAVYFSLAFWAIISFVNVQAISLKYNINNFYESGNMDFEYIEYLSSDASKVVYDFYVDNHSEFDGKQLNTVEQFFYNKQVVTSYNYREYYNDINWREFNISELKKQNLGTKIIENYYQD